MKSRYRRHHAFTMIELMVVIAIIGALATLLVIGIRYISGSTKSGAAKADLASIGGMFAEFNASGGMTRYPTSWPWRGQPLMVVNPSGNPWNGYDLDFWKVPMRTGTGATPPPWVDSLDAPSIALIPENAVARNASRAVLSTQLAMRFILSVPANKTAAGKLPADRVMVPEWMTGKLPDPGKDGVSGTGDDEGLKDIVYCEGNGVRYGGYTFRCKQTNVAALGTVPQIPPTSSDPYWEQDPNVPPLLLDAWGNPIIFVPATGLINVRGNLSGGAGSPTTVTAIFKNQPPGGTQNAFPSVALPNVTTLVPILSPEGANGPNYNSVATGGRVDGRPFFASGGPDGNLSTGDDNLYSFEK